MRNRVYALYVPELLPRFRRAMERLEDMRKLGQILIETDAEVHPDSNGRIRRQSADGHNWKRRRGLPIISKGVSGTAPNTDPVGELLRKERQRVQAFDDV